MRIVHTADPQLGYKQYGFEERAEDYLKAVQFVVKRAIDLRSDALVVAGDIFDMARPPARSVAILREAVDLARKAGIAVYGIEGNHDIADNHWLTVCDIQPLDMDLVPMGGPGPETLYMAGLNWSRPALFRTRLQQLADKARSQGHRVDVLVIHQTLAEMAGFSGAELTALDLVPQLQTMGTRVVLMGDIHDYKELELGGVRFIYPGSPEMTALNEQPLKTFSVVDINKDKVETRCEPIPVRPLVHLRIRTETDIDTLLVKVMDKSYPVPPMLVITYEPALQNFAKRAEAVLAGKALYRLIPMPEGQSVDLFSKVSQQNYERRGALHNLKDAVNAFFPEGSDEATLVWQLLEAPDNVRDITLGYARSKGLTM